MAFTTDPDSNPHLVFNDGEAIRHSDVQDALDLLEISSGRQEASRGAEYGNAHGLGYASLEGVDGVAGGGKFAATGTLYSPTPWAGIGFTKVELDAVDDLFLQNFAVVQTNGAAANKRIDQSAIRRFALGDEAFDLRSLLIANPAPGSGSPRWDTFGIRLGYGVAGDPELRHFKDAVTGALSSSNSNKRQGHTCEGDLFLGAQALPFQNPRDPLPSIEWAPLISIRRPVGETPAGVLDPANFFLHTMPTRLHTEDVMGYEFHFSGTEGGANWDEDALGLGSMEKKSAGPGALFVFPRTMNEACRLTGIGIINDGANTDFDISIGRFQYATSGFPAFVKLAGLGSASEGGPINGGTSGFRGAGMGDWDPEFPAAGVPSGAASGALPIWGNGQSFGPCFSDHRQGYSGGGSEFSKLCVRIQDATGEDWALGDRIHMLRFYFTR